MNYLEEMQKLNSLNDISLTLYIYKQSEVVAQFHFDEQHNIILNYY